MHVARLSVNSSLRCCSLPLGRQVCRLSGSGPLRVSVRTKHMELTCCGLGLHVICLCQEAENRGLVTNCVSSCLTLWGERRTSVERSCNQFPSWVPFLLHRFPLSLMTQTWHQAIQWNVESHLELHPQNPAHVQSLELEYSTWDSVF